MANTSKKLTKEELNKLIKEAFLEYAFSMNEEEGQLDEQQEALMEDELEEIQIFNKLFGGSKDFSKGQQLGSSLGSALSPGAGRAMAADKPAAKPVAKPKPAARPTSIELPVDSGDADELEITRESANVALLKKVIKEMIRKEQANVKLHPMHPTAGAGESQPIVSDDDEEEQQTTKPVTKVSGADPDLDPSKLAGMKLHPKMRLSERSIKALRRAIREAIQKEVYKNPQKTEKYVSQLKGNLETGNVGLKNLMNARNHATDDDERDAIQGLIDKHPHTKKSMYKAE